MPQFGRPDSDVSNTGVWSTEPLFEKIDESSASDADFVTRTPSFSAIKEFEVGLSNVTDPASSSDHIIRCRGRQTSGSTGTLTAKLYQGTTLIATLTQNPITASFATYTYTLSSGEADSITDYSDLRLRIGVSFPAARIPEVSWAEFEVPDAGGADATVTPAAIAAPVSLPAATGSAGSTVSPASISSPVAIPQAVLSVGSTMTPAAIAAPVELPLAALSAQSTVTPGVIPLAALLPLPTAAAVAVVTPNVSGIAIGLPAAAASAGSTVTPGVVALVIGLPLPTASGVSSATVTPAVIAVVLALPAPTITVPDTWRVIEPSDVGALTGASGQTITPPTGGTVSGAGGQTITPPSIPPLTVP